MAPPSSLMICRSGTAVTGVVSVSLLSAGVGSGPLMPSSVISPVLEISATPDGNGSSTSTAKIAVPLPPPPARLPMDNVHREPAPASGTQTQPAVLAPTLKVVSAGTVSVISTPVASWSPTLL